MLAYIQNRWNERSSRIQLLMVAILLAQIAFPQYADTINTIAIGLGITGVAVPDKAKVN